MTNGTMKALVVEAADGAFRLTDLPVPVPSPRQVLVRIAVSGVNPLDLKIRAGTAPHARHPFPAVLGIDLAGVVETVGAEVEGFHPGDEVYAMAGGVAALQGSLAEYAAVDADLLARKPGNITMQEATALPLVVITAWEGLVDRAHVRAGQTVLVQGGAGGVGHVAVQIARAFGAEVFATYRGDDAAYLASIGATPIDTQASAVEAYVAEHTGGQGFDLVYDTGGGALLDASFAAVRREGHVVSCLGWGSHSLAPLSFKNGSYSGVFTLLPLLTGEGRARHGEILAEAAGLVEAGRLRPRLDPRTFQLCDADAAHQVISKGGAKGKVVVTVT